MGVVIDWRYRAFATQDNRTFDLAMRKMEHSKVRRSIASEKIESLCMLVSESPRIEKCTMRRHLSVEGRIVLFTVPNLVQQAA
jgi:hypothetical protein